MEASAASDWPEFATREEASAFWQGVRRGIRESGRDRAHPHMPEHFSLDLARDDAAPSLTSTKLLDPWPHIPDDEKSQGLTSHGPAEPAPRADRHDGFTVANEQLFLRTLADTGVVADACRATGLTRQAAYARRRSAAGRAFSLAWDAAQLIARGPIADDVMSRARHGVIERVYRNGELVAERHRYDNRLTMAVLARLDRLAAGDGANAPVVQAIAQEFDQFLDLLPKGLEAAEEFLELRIPPRNGEGDRSPSASGGGVGTAEVTEPELLARLDHYQDFGVGLPVEIDCDDLDPEEMADWTEEQFERAEVSGFLGMLSESEWPEGARDGSADGTDGMCQMRQLYLLHYPPKRPRPAPEDDYCGCSVWEADEGWMTDFPPPPGFDGHEEGEPGEDDYKRELAAEEMPLIEAEEAADREAARKQLAEMEAARRRFFALDGEPSEATDPGASGEAE